MALPVDPEFWGVVITVDCPKQVGWLSSTGGEGVVKSVRALERKERQSVGAFTL